MKPNKLSVNQWLIRGTVNYCAGIYKNNRFVTINAMELLL